MTARFILSGDKGDFHLTVGLEVHAQIASKAKLFSDAPTRFGAEPNTQVSYVDAGFPGMLPVLNKECVKQAVKTCLGLRGRINLTSLFDRKNYFYPDLPQGYQISQFFKPIMENGYLEIVNKEGESKRIRVNRLHIEQDAGKSIHDMSPDYSLVDLNRSGVGLMEIVTEPDLHSAEEAGTYVRTLRNLLIYIGSSDGNMEEGSLRVDANVSVAPVGGDLGIRVEIKNLNSVRFMQRAILYEASRQIEVIEGGGIIVQETRLFDTETGETRRMRSKEDAQKYRYFPDPDLPPLVLDEDFVNELRDALPELPDAKRARFQKEYGLSFYDADVLTNDFDVLAFFEAALPLLKKATPKMLTNWLMGEVLGAARRDDVMLAGHAMTPQCLVNLLERVADKTISGKMAKEVFEESWRDSRDPGEIIEARGLAQIRSPEVILSMIQKVLDAMPDKVVAYRGGQDKLFGFFVGAVMKETKGRADPVLVNTLLREALEKS